jgi:enoyl-CoA hydratase/carnithine racemase
MSDVIVTKHQDWALIRIDRAAKRNSLNQAARLDLLAALRTLQNHARAIILTGSDAWFCCGADIKERAQFVAEGKEDTAGSEGMELAAAIREFPGVVIAAVNGLALGYGVNLVNCCDLALASDRAQLGLPELRHGSFASMSAATSLLSGLSRKRAGWMIFNADPIDAHTALAWGLINEIVPADRLGDRAVQLASKIAAFHPAAIAETKAALAKIPELGPQWGPAMEFGQTVGARIKAKTSAD